MKYQTWFMLAFIIPLFSCEKLFPENMARTDLVGLWMLENQRINQDQYINAKGNLLLRKDDTFNLNRSFSGLDTALFSFFPNQADINGKWWMKNKFSFILSITDSGNGALITPPVNHEIYIAHVDADTKYGEKGLAINEFFNGNFYEYDFRKAD